MNDRRQYERIELGVSCRVSAAGIRGSVCNGVVENISRSGLLCEINGNAKRWLPEVGDFLAVEVPLTERRAFGKKSLRCRGSVVRVLPITGGAKIAVAVEHMTFRTVNESGRQKTAKVVWDEIAFRA